MSCRWILALLFLSVAPLCGQSCPWMNAATAGGALGGTVSETYSEKAGCLFTAGASELRITVEPVSGAPEFGRRRAKCSTPADLRGIGNEAFYCATNRIVSGRVRDRMFTLEIKPAAKQDTFRKMADIVAGNLY